MEYKIKTVIFDHGDVIQRFDNDKFIKNISRGEYEEFLLNEIIFESDLYKLIDTNSITPKDFFKIVKTKFFNKVERKYQLKVNESEFFYEFTNRFSELDNRILGMMDKLKTKGYKIGILSNTNKLDYTVVISKIKKIIPIDFEVMSHWIGVRKPCKQAYYKLSEIIQLYYSEILFIDNQEKNIRPASDIGIKTILYDGDPSKLESKLMESGIKI